MSNTRKLKKDEEGWFICPYCGKPMVSISHIFSEIDQWKWNSRTKKYKELPTECSEKCIYVHLASKFPRWKELGEISWLPTGLKIQYRLILEPKWWTYFSETIDPVLFFRVLSSMFLFLVYTVLLPLHTLNRKAI